MTNINQPVNVMKFDVQKFDAILARGLCSGVGIPNSQMCIEAAICYTLGLPHGDDPLCVASGVRAYKIMLNDSAWSSTRARAKGLRDLGLAQLGSLEAVDDREFVKRLMEKTIRTLIPKLFREVANGDRGMLAAADRCEQEGTEMAAAGAEAAARAAAATAKTAAAAAMAARAEARAAAAAARAAGAARAAEAKAAAAAEAAARVAEEAAAWAATAARAAGEARLATAARTAGEAEAVGADSYLILSAELALEVLRELESPGVKLLDK